jgi:hypothetical protein
MSNTRKEIAARLGFAANPVAKVAFAATPADLKAWLQIVKRELVVLNKIEKANARKGEIDLDISSELGNFSRLAKAIESGNKAEARKAIKAEIDVIGQSDLNQILPSGLIAWANSTTASRSGVKAAFAASLSEIKAWSQALKKEEQASLKTQKANERANRGEYDIDSATEVRVFSGLNAALQRGDKLLVRKLLDEAKREIDATVFRQGVPQALIAWANTTTASRPGAKTRMTREQTEEQKAGLKIMSAADPAVGAKIATLIKEGKPQDQAVAIALDMKRRGEL